MDISDFAKTTFSLTDPEFLAALKQKGTIRKVPKGTRLFSAGEPQTKLPFVLSGLLRGFLLDQHGTDTTDCFLCRKGEAAMGCYDFGQPSHTYVETLTDSTLLFVPMDLIEYATIHCQEVAQLYRTQTQLAQDKKARHNNAKKLTSVKERYAWFQAEYPEVDALMRKKQGLQAHVASFVGTAPETLSRILNQQK